MLQCYLVRIRNPLDRVLKQKGSITSLSKIMSMWIYTAHERGYTSVCAHRLRETSTLAEQSYCPKPLFSPLWKFEKTFTNCLVCTCVYVRTHMYSTEIHIYNIQLVPHSLLPPHGHRDGTQVIVLGSKSLYLLHHLTNPFLKLLEDFQQDFSKVLRLALNLLCSPRLWACKPSVSLTSDGDYKQEPLSTVRSKQNHYV